MLKVRQVEQKDHPREPSHPTMKHDCSIDGDSKEEGNNRIARRQDHDDERIALWKEMRLALGPTVTRGFPFG